MPDGLFSVPKPSGPSPAMVAAQETQARLAQAEEDRLKTQQLAEEATRRAAAGRTAGRSLLMADDIGITDDERAPLQKKTGG